MHALQGEMKKGISLFHVDRHGYHITPDAVPALSSTVTHIRSGHS